MILWPKIQLYVKTFGKEPSLSANDPQVQADGGVPELSCGRRSASAKPMVDSFDDIFENDPDGLLNVKPKASRRRPATNGSVGSLSRCWSSSVRRGRAPEPNQFDIAEFQLYAQLKGIRENDELRMAMEPLDEYGLLGEPKAAPESIDDIFSQTTSSADFVGGGRMSRTCFEFKHTPKELERAEADFVAQRKPVKDFADYAAHVQGGPAGAAGGAHGRSSRSSNRTLQPGNYFIHNGMLLYLESVDTLAENREYSSGSRKREDGRTLTIFENGTMSNLLFRSLYKGLLMNGKTVTQTEEEAHKEFNQNFGGVTDDDDATGMIYILQSLSEDPQIQSIENLYKIGYTAGSLDFRLHKAEESPTYLMAGVKVIQVFECYNMNPQKLEHLLHRFFGSARLMIDVFDAAGVRHSPREWFVAPLSVIEEAVNRIVDGSIIHFRFDGNQIIPA